MLTASRPRSERAYYREDKGVFAVGALVAMRIRTVNVYLFLHL